MKNCKPLISVVLIICLFTASCEQKNCTLRIQANKENAQIFIDNDSVGVAPLNVLITSGKHNIVVRLKNTDTSHYYYRKKVSFVENETKDFYAKLEIRFTDQYYWNNATDPEGAEEYKKQYPEGKYITEVNEKLETLYYEEFKNAKKLNEAIENYKNYNSLFPFGKFITEADTLLENRFFNSISSTVNTSNAVSIFKKYSSLFPSGKYIQKFTEEFEIKYFNLINNSQLLDTAEKYYNKYKSVFPEGQYLQKCDSVMKNFSGVFTDKRDGKTYKWVKIGTQNWMVENLDYKMKNSWYYGYKEINSKYGRLYVWSAAIKACPDEWHLPSDAEWTELEKTLGGQYSAGGKLKSTSPLWSTPNSKASNSSSFSALPAGYRYPGERGVFVELGKWATFWASTPVDKKDERNRMEEAWARYLISVNGRLNRDRGDRTYGASVRCLQN